MDNFKEVYARMLFAANVRTQAELAQILGIRQSSISDAKKRNRIPSDWFMRLYDACGVEVDWQRFGTGPVYTEKGIQNVGESKDSGESLHETPAAPIKTFFPDTLPIYSPIAQNDGLFPVVDRQRFPQALLDCSVEIFRVLDGTMAPSLNMGALVAVVRGRPVNDGDIVAVRWDGRLLFRRVCRERKGYTFRAENAGLSEVNPSIPEADWDSVYYGKAVWAFQVL